MSTLFEQEQQEQEQESPESPEQESPESPDLAHLVHEGAITALDGEMATLRASMERGSPTVRAYLADALKGLERARADLMARLRVVRVSTIGERLAQALADFLGDDEQSRKDIQGLADALGVPPIFRFVLGDDGDVTVIPPTLQVNDSPAKRSVGRKARRKVRLADGRVLSMNAAGRVLFPPTNPDSPGWSRDANGRVETDGDGAPVWHGVSTEGFVRACGALGLTQGTEWEWAS